MYAVTADVEVHCSTSRLIECWVVWVVCWLRSVDRSDQVTSFKTGSFCGPAGEDGFDLIAVVLSVIEKSCSTEVFWLIPVWQLLEIHGAVTAVYGYGEVR